MKLNDTAQLLRTYLVGASDDTDWPASGGVPADAIVFHHPGGTLSLYFVYTNAAGSPLARGAGVFTFELMRVLRGFTCESEAIPATGANVHYAIKAPAGSYVVRISSEASHATAAALQIWGQAG